MESTLYDLNAPASSLRLRAPRPWNSERAGSLVTINAITVGAAVQMWLDLIASHLEASQWQRFLWRPGTGLQSDSAPIDREIDCWVCQGRTQL